MSCPSGTRSNTPAGTSGRLCAYRHAGYALRRPRGRPRCTASNDDKLVWVETSSKSVLTTSLEAGFSSIVCGDRSVMDTWQQLARFNAMHIDGDIVQDASGATVGRVWTIRTPEDLKQAERQRNVEGIVVMDASDWKVIPAENLVALFQGSPAQLLAAATSAAEARVMLEALEVGTSGVVLRTEDPAQVRQLAAYLRQQAAEGAAVLEYQAARVVRVAAVGMGDRVCVDLARAMVPGEGLLVGSFARCLMLVHSECEESQYINSRPFRVNAGPVHAYVQLPGGRTGYLSELRSGQEVLVADPNGTTRTVLVGRVKIEARPLVLVEVETEDGQRHSTLLQNAETVKLVGLASCGGTGQAGSSSCSDSGSGSSSTTRETNGSTGSSRCGMERAEGDVEMVPSIGKAAEDVTWEALSTSYVDRPMWAGAGDRGKDCAQTEVGSQWACTDGMGQVFGKGQSGISKRWRAISVATMEVGDEVLVLRQAAARHTGISVQENISER